MDFWYGLLKVISMIATGIFGAIALLTKYKNEDDKVTIWGKLALGGILISVSISIGLYVLETVKAKEEAVKAQSRAEKAQADAEQTSQLLNGIFDRAKTAADKQELGLEKTNELQSDVAENLKKQEQGLDLTDKIANDMNASIFAQRILLTDNEKIMTGMNEGLTKQTNLLAQSQEISLNINRSLFALEKFQISFTFVTPLTHPDLTNYIMYLDKQADSLFFWKKEKDKDIDSYRRPLPAEGLQMLGRSTLLVEPDSPHIPSDDTPEGKLVNKREFIVEFYRPPFDVHKIARRYIQPDVEIWVTAYANPPNNLSNRMELIINSLEYRKVFLQRGTYLDIEESTQTGRILSQLDLSGIMVVVRFVNGLDKSIKLAELILHQPKGKCIKLDRGVFNRIDNHLVPEYSTPHARITFPHFFNRKEGNLMSFGDTILYQILPGDFKMTTDCNRPISIWR